MFQSRCEQRDRYAKACHTERKSRSAFNGSSFSRRFQTKGVVDPVAAAVGARLDAACLLFRELGVCYTVPVAKMEWQIVQSLAVCASLTGCP